MKISLFYFWGLKNSGDMAINLGAIKLLKTINPSQISLVSRFDENSVNFKKSKEFIAKHSCFFVNTSLVPGPYRFERERNKIKLLKEYLLNLALLKNIIDNKEIKRVIEESDIIFFNGGNLMRIQSISDYLRLIALFIPIKAAKKKNKKIVLLPHSSNNMNKMQKWLLSKFLDNFDFIFSREEFSFNIFKELTSKKIESQIDLCFFKNIEILQSRQTPVEVKNIAITVRKTGIGDIGYLDEGAIQNLKSTLIDYIHLNKASNIAITIVNQTQKDLDFSTELYNEIRNLGINCKLVVEYDTFSLSDLYAKFDLVIGMRLHSLILAASVGTPVVGLFSSAWGLKNKGTMNMLGLKCYMIDEENENIKNIIQYNVENFHLSKKIILVKYNSMILNLQNIVNKIE